MKPASTTRSGASASMAAASARRRRRDRQRPDGRRRRRDAGLAAISSPAASGRLLITMRDRCGDRARSTAAISAAMLEPRPEIRMTRRFTFRHVDAQRDARSGSAGSRPPPGLRCVTARSASRLTRRRCRAHRPLAARRCRSRTRSRPTAESARSPRRHIAAHHQHHADAAIEHAMHLGGRRHCPPAAASRRSAAAASDARRCAPQALGQHPVRVFDEAAAGDVRHALESHSASSASTGLT